MSFAGARSDNFVALDVAGSRSGLRCVLYYVDIPFVGSDAIVAGWLTPSQLRHRYHALYRGVYVPNGHAVSLRDRIIGASLACPSAVITGIAASAMHGAKWVGRMSPSRSWRRSDNRPG